MVLRSKTCLLGQITEWKEKKKEEKEKEKSISQFVKQRLERN